MKEALLFIKNFLEKNGVIKVIVAFVILIISVLCIRGNVLRGAGIFALTGYISLLYIIIAGGVYLIAGIVNEIKELFHK
jgi:hypothetical protein